MTKEERIKIAIEKGCTCNPDTGDVFNKNGILIKSKNIDGYIKCSITIEKKTYIFLAHQFIYYWVYSEVVDCIDHKNRDRSDNRIKNLRSVSRQQNNFNREAKGYRWHKKANKWQSQISLNNKTIYLGYFDKEEDASNAYKDAKKIYHII